MESYLTSAHFDLITPDRKIVTLQENKAVVLIEGISPAFVVFDIDKSRIFFNLKSSLAQLGVDASLTGLSFNRSAGKAEAALTLFAICDLGKKMLSYLRPGMYIGKLFAADE